MSKHLLSQGVRATDGFVRCAYRGANGTACAVGCLIPDALYSSQFEQKNLYHIHELLSGRDDAKPLATFIAANVRLLDELQSMHDLRTPDRWRYELRKIAARHGLLDHVVDPRGVVCVDEQPAAFDRLEFRAWASYAAFFASLGTPVVTGTAFMVSIFPDPLNVAPIRAANEIELDAYA